MEDRGVPGHGARGLTPGTAEWPPRLTEPAGETEPGDARVDEAVARLADLAELPVAEHPPVFEYVHERLTEALGDLDVRDPAEPGSPGGPGSGAQPPGAPGG